MPTSALSTSAADEPQSTENSPELRSAEEPNGALCLLCSTCFTEREVAYCPMCGEPIPGGPLFLESRPGLLLKKLRFDQPAIVGGTSYIYPATLGETGARVAAKISHREASMNGEFLFQEGVALRQLSHASIPEIHEQGCLANGTPYVIIDFIEGRSLEAMIIEHGAFSGQATAAMGAVLCDVLGHVHARGILHRDIKPDNIIVKAARPFLIDFGTAQFLEDRAGDSSTSGTTWYMPPEQVMAHELDYSADVYALGVSLYQMLTGGVLPFHDDDPNRVAILKVAEDPLPIREYFPDVPEALNTIIMRSIARDREERYATMDIFKKALEGFLFLQN